MIFKKKIRVFIIVISFGFIQCDNKTMITKIEDIDSKYKFTAIERFNLDKDSLYPFVELFYLDKYKDSVYVVGTKEMKNYTIRSRGWSYRDNKVGDWYYEKVYSNQNIKTDSVINFVSFCGEYVINTIKKFQNNSLDKFKGYAYDLKFKKDIRVNDTVDIKLEFVYDTIMFKRVSNEFYIFKPKSLEDYCDSSNYLIDSFPIFNNTAKMKFQVDEIGEIKILGYYYLLNKQNSNDTIKRAQKIFTEIDLEVK